MRIGVFGGTYDPVHLGHLIVAESAADQLGLDQVRLVPANIQPFKQQVITTGSEHRLAMLQAAVHGASRLVVDDGEIQRGGVSYTIDTVRALRRRFPEDELLLMVGADAARGFPDWRSAEAITEEAEVVVLSREGSPIARDEGHRRMIAVPAIGISATMIRAYVQAGRSIRYLVPEGVYDYIVAHGLYRTG